MSSVYVARAHHIVEVVLQKVHPLTPLCYKRRSRHTGAEVYTHKADRHVIDAFLEATNASMARCSL